MLYVNLTPQFRSGAVRSLRSLAPVAESVRAKLFKGASTAAIGAMAGWGGVMLLGAVLMTGASHETTPTVTAPDAAVATLVAPVVSTPLPVPVVAAAPKEVAIAATPAPTPAPAKISQHVDMSTTAAIPDPAKPHHKPHKKKPLDNAN